MTDAPVRAIAPREGEAWPRRPALEFLLARAVSTALPAGGWREWLLARHGVALADGVGLAGIAAAALGLPAGEYWLATPIHLVAGLDTVRLHPQGLLQLTAAEAQLLAADFAPVFAGSGWQLHATGARELLLAAPRPLAAASDDPVDWLGADPRAGLPRGPGAPALRTLATELEMWLHAHAINRRRHDAGLLPVSGLWLWGGGSSRPPAAAPAGRLRGDDLVATALWARSSAAVDPSASGWRELVRAAASAAGRDSWHVLTSLADLEPHWMQPLLADWRAGYVRRIELVAGRRLHVLDRAARWRFWARQQPWWERIAP